MVNLYQKKSYFKQCKAQESKRNLQHHEVILNENPQPVSEHQYFEETPLNHEFLLPDNNVNIDLEDAQVTVETNLHDSHVNDDGWKTGRRVVELSCLAQQMYCSTCASPLHFSNIEKERRYGLASILYIRCQNSVCNTLNDIKTGKRTAGSFDVNSKLALGNLFSNLQFTKKIEKH